MSRIELGQKPICTLEDAINQVEVLIHFCAQGQDSFPQKSKISQQVGTCQDSKVVSLGYAKGKEERQEKWIKTESDAELSRHKVSM